MLKEKGRTVSLVNPRIISKLDTKTLDRFKNYKAVITIEGTSIDGGLGQKIASYMSLYGTKVYNFGLKKEVIDRLSIDEVLKNNHMSKEEIVKLILSL
jgi:1-deoxy-D-xylulose-5-phosphate synthase